MQPTNRMLKNAAAARSLAARSMVLLKNINNTLPLLGSADEPVKVAVFGVGQVYTVKGGTGSGNVNNIRTVSFLEGLEECPSIQPDADLSRKYRSWCLGHENQCVEGFMVPKGTCNEEMPITDQEIRSFAISNSAAIMILTRVAGEGADLYARDGELYLNDGERALMNSITAHFEKTILVLNTAGYLEIADYVPKFSAVLFMGLPGQDAGAAADVLTAAELPTGRLTDTWPRHYLQYPGAEDYRTLHGNGNMVMDMGQTTEQINVYYHEDVFVGYRYFDTFGEDVLFPFGYGLSYGKSELCSYSVAVTGDEVTVTTEVENTGSVYADRQVVQVYLTCPGEKLAQPLQKLCAFGKTASLLPGETETLSLHFRLSDFASFGEASASYILEKGYYYIRIGTSSRATSVCGAVYLPQDVTTLTLSDRMGHTPADFETISPADIPAYSYSGEAEELEFARKHAVRISARDFKTGSVSYRKGFTMLPRGRSHLQLKDVLNGEATLEEFVAAMDTSALCALACGIGMDMSGFPTDSMPADFEQPFSGILGGGGMKCVGAAGETANLTEQYGIPPITLSDGPAGIRIKQKLTDDEGNVTAMQLCTAFPVGSLLASSWDPEVLTEFGEAVAVEMLEYGVELWLAPGMNIHRNPLCGRNFEYFSEDPLLTGFCAASIAKGVQKHGVGVTIKHFAGNSQETQRTSSNDIISQRALREIYLKGFEIAVRTAQPWAIMTSYNDINGMPSANNYDLCTAIARDEWGFTGLIMTDWGGGISSYPLNICAGNDMIQPGGPDCIEALANAIASGTPVSNNGVRPYEATLTRAALEASALHILTVILRCTAVQRLLKQS